MGEQAHGLRLMPEPAQEFLGCLCGEDLGLDGLDGDQAEDEGVERPVDPTHCPLPDLVLDLVAPATATEIGGSDFRHKASPRFSGLGEPAAGE